MGHQDITAPIRMLLCMKILYRRNVNALCIAREMYEKKKWYFDIIQMKLISITNLDSEFETNDLTRSPALQRRSLNGK